MAGVIDVQQLIAGLKELSTTYAVEALKNPKVTEDRSYEYGLHCGNIQGIARAEELVLKLLNDGEESGKQRTKIKRAY